MMSKEFPCVHWDNNKCKKFSEDHVTSWCLSGPCASQQLSNADRIRAMSDEELAWFLAKEATRIAKPAFDYCGMAVNEEVIFLSRLLWLQEPAEECE